VQSFVFLKIGVGRVQGVPARAVFGVIGEIGLVVRGFVEVIHQPRGHRRHTIPQRHPFGDHHLEAGRALLAGGGPLQSGNRPLQIGDEGSNGGGALRHPSASHTSSLGTPRNPIGR
jgi:hypothetical protein